MRDKVSMLYTAKRLPKSLAWIKYCPVSVNTFKGSTAKNSLLLECNE